MFLKYRIYCNIWCIYIIELQFEKTPQLIIDNTIKLIHPAAFCRFLAYYSLLNGDNAWEEYLIDSIVDTIMDYLRGK